MLIFWAYPLYIFVSLIWEKIKLNNKNISKYNQMLIFSVYPFHIYTSLIWKQKLKRNNKNISKSSTQKVLYNILMVNRSEYYTYINNASTKC